MRNYQRLLQVDRSSLKGMHFVVLKGGPGKERAISLQSGASVADALRSRQYYVTEIDVTKDLDLPKGTDLVFNTIHGTFGEDGCLQDLLEERGVPFTGDGAAGCRLAFDKILAKRRFVRAGIPTSPFEVLSSGEQPSFAPPFVLKPPCQGSSIGVHVVHNRQQIPLAMENVLKYGDKVLLESFFLGRELTVSVVANTVLPIVEIVSTNGVYSYENKYVSGRSEYFAPARLSSDHTAATMDTALAAHQALGLQLCSRVDILLSEEGRLNVLEVNTIPGMTPFSLMPRAAAAIGIDLSLLCEIIAVISLQKWKKA
ncbi:D-alanine--D-alanine ligase B [Candidatus Xiphinematobacter sp. Idaho Grape]|uniref:D-alanine--D-alanine ligase family protein n=1 Tax=Candidatus Xiphinematobacter sp. Idaho Grape TaxID=1704307 RepID=UPI0007069A06|nr:D-alanine--D-alanine ligase [Candidatus Xiphinematobacter sp. Idaho Grape]ALJ56537.1 D-alanine--D-alanine ligase B [Candidatus Xiphinematobacter sp. Idaho Grape]